MFDGIERVDGQPDSCTAPPGPENLDDAANRPSPPLPFPGPPPLPSPGPGPQPVPIPTPVPVPPGFVPDEVIDAIPLPDPETEDAPPPVPIPGPDVPDPDDDPIDIPDPPTVCNDPCFQPTADNVLANRNKLTQLEAILNFIANVVSELLDRLGEQSESDISEQLEELTQSVECLSSLWCSPSAVTMTYTPCNDGDPVPYTNVVSGLTGVLDVVQTVDAFSQFRYESICSLLGASQSVDREELFEGITSQNTRIQDYTVLPLGIRAIQIDILEYQDNNKDVRIYKTADGGRVHGSFGVVAIGQVVGSKIFWMESSNMFFPTIQLEIPEYVSQAAAIRVAMPAGNRYKIFDSGERW